MGQATLSTPSLDYTKDKENFLVIVVHKDENRQFGTEATFKLAVSAISHNFLFSAQFRIILHSPHNSACYFPYRTFSHIFSKIALDRIKTKHIVWKSRTFSYLADLNLGRFTSLIQSCSQFEPKIS